MATKPVSITLNGDRRLYYRTMDAMEAERRMGKSIRRALEDTAIGDLVILLWAGLRHASERVSPDEVAKWMDEAKVDQPVFGWWNVVSEALIESGLLPRPDAGEVPPDRPT